MGPWNILSRHTCFAFKRPASQWRSSSILKCSLIRFTCISEWRCIGMCYLITVRFFNQPQCKDLPMKLIARRWGLGEFHGAKNWSEVQSLRMQYICRKITKVKTILNRRWVICHLLLIGPTLAARRPRTVPTSGFCLLLRDFLPFWPRPLPPLPPLPPLSRCRRMAGSAQPLPHSWASLVLCCGIFRASIMSASKWIRKFWGIDAFCKVPPEMLLPWRNLCPWAVSTG